MASIALVGENRIFVPIHQVLFKYSILAKVVFLLIFPLFLHFGFCISQNHCIFAGTIQIPYNMAAEDLIFDEDAAVRFIMDFIPEEDRKNLTEDDIVYVLDVIDEFYESEGLLSEDETAEEASIDEEKMYNYVLKAAKKDQINITTEQLQLILEGEYEYGVSIGIYEEED